MATSDSNRYYILRGSSDPAVLGNNTGIKQADIKRIGFRDPEEYDRLLSDLGTNRYWQIRETVPDGNYDVQYVEMFGKSKLTDFVRFGPFLINCPFMISEKVHRVFSMHRLSSVTTFPAQIKSQNGEFHSYRLLYIMPMPLPMVDFSLSTYYTEDLVRGIVPMVFESEAEFAEAHSQEKLVEVEKISVKPAFADTDLFALHTGQLVVSERLKIDLEENHATSGINLLPAFGNVAWPVVSVAC